MGADPRAQTRTSESDGIGNDARAPRPHGAGFIFYFFTRRKRLFPDGFVGKGIGRHQVLSGWITGRVARSLSRNDWVIRAWAPSSITVQVVGDTVLSPMPFWNARMRSLRTGVYPLFRFSTV